jgi:hypothetical protein
MNVPALGVAATANYFQSTQPTRPPLTNTAQLLGLSTDQLNIDMRSGTKLSSLATQKGLSTSALLSSVESDLQANAPADSTASSSRLKQIATNVIQGAGHGGHHRGGGGASALALLLGTDGSTSTDGTQSSSSALTSTAALLGLSSTQLASDLQSGTTLSSIADKQGVKSSDLLSSVESDLKANAPKGAPTMSDRQLQQVATNVINGISFAPPTATSGAERSAAVSSSRGASSLGSTSSIKATNNLNSLASATGLDPSSLLSRLQSGQNLSSLLGSAGQTGYGSTVGGSVSGGVMYDEYA